MNNEPVAYFRKNYDGDWVEAEAGYEDESIPLYTHPHSDKSVKAKTPMLVLDGNRVYPTVKTLTDEEIRNIAKEIDLESGVAQWKYDFARAILRKAQEK